MGLDIYLRWRDQTEAETRAQYTGFETTGAVGYLRSSYNDGGFNAWCARMLGEGGYYYIFDYVEDAERQVGVGEDGDSIVGFFPDWDASRARCRALLQRARELDNLFVIPVRLKTHRPPATEYPSADDVLAFYRQQIAQPHQFEAWSAWYGDVHANEPLTVRAVLQTKPALAGFPGTLPFDIALICEGDDPHRYYINSLEQCLAFIDLGEQKHGWLHWSS